MPAHLLSCLDEMHLPHVQAVSQKPKAEAIQPQTGSNNFYVSRDTTSSAPNAWAKKPFPAPKLSHINTRAEKQTPRQPALHLLGNLPHPPIKAGIE